MKKLVAILALTLVTSSAFASLTEQGEYVKSSLAQGETCSTTWSADSSRPGVPVEVEGVRTMVAAGEYSDRTQFLVYHPSVGYNIWVWDFRLNNIVCH